MRLRLPRRRLWCAAIYLICLWLVVTAVDLVLVKVRRTIHPGYDTTRIIAPTLPDGRIDYLRYLDDGRSVGVTPVNNAAVPFLQALGRSALPGNQPTDGITDRLGMPPIPERGDYLTDFADYCKLHSIPLPPDYSPEDIATTWPPAVAPAARQWIDSNVRPLGLLEQASLRTKFWIPFDGGNRPELLVEVLLPHVNALTNIGALILTRAVARLQSGDSDGCIADLLAVHRLARLVSQNETMIECMAAQQRLEIPALQVDRLVAGSGKLTADQAKSFAAQLHALDDFSSIGKYLDGERMMVLDLLQALAADPERFDDVLATITGRNPGVPRAAFLFIPIPWESDMRALNHMYDGALAALRQEPYSRRRAALQLWEQQAAATKNASSVSIVWSPNIFISTLMLSVTSIHQKQEIAIMEKRLTEISVALAAYKADHGQYPASLNGLIPADLREIPVDLFSESPPIYRTTASGYTLYSVGPDMIDNNGLGDDIAANQP